MIRLSILVSVLCCTCIALPTVAQRTSELSADVPDTRTLAVQRKVETLFLEGEHKRAFFIYHEELAPLGDKYAQYMVGYMYDKGMGVARDDVKAVAWYRLAGERNTPEFVAVYKDSITKLDEAKRLRAEVEYLQLRREFSDLAVLFSSIKRDVKVLSRPHWFSFGRQQQRGNDSRSGPRGMTQSGVGFTGAFGRTLKERLETLIALGEFEGVSTDPSRVNLRELERLVEEKIDAGND